MEGRAILLSKGRAIDNGGDAFISGEAENVGKLGSVKEGVVLELGVGGGREVVEAIDIPDAVELA